MASAELSPPSAARARRSPDIPEPWHGRHRTALLVTACILPLHVLWLAFLATGGGDLAAQVAWAEFAKMYPGSAYNLFWYGGLHIANYSLISPYLMALFGVVPVTLLSGVSSTWLAASIVERTGIRRPLWLLPWSGSRCGARSCRGARHSCWAWPSDSAPSSRT